MENEISGIILDSQERGRSSRFVKLLACEGAVYVLVPKSFSSSQWSDLTQPLHQVRYLVQETAKGSTFKEGVVDERFGGIRENFSAIESAQMMRLVALKIVKPGLPCPEFYQAFQIHLRALSDASYREINPSIILSSFLVKTLVHEGLFNPVDEPVCQLCHEKTEIMTLSKSLEWYCQRHSYGSKQQMLSSYDRSQMIFFAQNRRLSALQQINSCQLSTVLLPLIQAL